MAETRLKISVCIVTYNHGRYIDACLASAIGQQVDADLEILVGDDCSSDDTRAIVTRYAERYPGLVVPVFHEQNVGGSQNYHVLIGKASGDYIAHLDGDDFWLPGKLARQLAFLEENRHCSAAYANAIVVNDSGDLRAKFNGTLPHEFDLNYVMENGNFLNASSVMYRSGCKNVLLAVNGDILDYRYNILLAGQGMLGYINSFLVVYRLNSVTSIIVNRFEKVMGLYWEAILCGWELGAREDAVRRCICGYYRSLIRTAIVRRKPKDAFRQYRKMAVECPLATWALLLRSLATIPRYMGRDFLRSVARRIFKGGAEILFDR